MLTSYSVRSTNVGSLIDRFRQTPSIERQIVVFGGDPDMDTTGWAVVNATITTPALTQPRVTSAAIGLILPARGHLRELEQADEMIKAIALFAFPATLSSTLTAAFVEAQQVYPDPDEDPRTRVAKANDLLRCAQVTGALQAWAVARGMTVVRSVLPSGWKGQTKKDVTLAQMQGRLIEAPIHIAAELRGKLIAPITGSQLHTLPQKLNHAIDALGIAVYGLDVLSRHLELLPPVSP